MAGSRKVYAPEFKLQAVQMITDQRLSVAVKFPTKSGQSGSGVNS